MKFSHIRGRAIFETQCIFTAAGVASIYHVKYENVDESVDCLASLAPLTGKAFEITYVRIKFHSSRPESFAIYRRTNETGDWSAYQFYSSSCRATYGMSAEKSVSRDNEARAICRDDFSDISPLSGASVAFSTLEGRPSAYQFDTSTELQVTSTRHCPLT